MNPLVVIALLSGVPVALIFLFRVNAAVAFLALCAGNLLALYFGNDAVKLLQAFTSKTDPTLYAGVKIVLLVLPMFITIILLQKGIRGAKHLLNLVPTVLTGVVTGLLAVPLLTDGTKNNIYGTQVWTIASKMQGTVVAVAVLVSMFMLWTTQKPRRDKRHH